MPQLRAIAGFHHAQMLADEKLGHGLLVATWQDEDHAARGDAILDRLRSDALHRAHLTLQNIETYTLVRDAADTRATTRA